MLLRPGQSRAEPAVRLDGGQWLVPGRTGQGVPGGQLRPGKGRFSLAGGSAFPFSPALAICNPWQGLPGSAARLPLALGSCSGGCGRRVLLED